MERLVSLTNSLIKSWPTGWGILLLWIIIFNLLAFGILGSSMGIKDFWKMYRQGILWFLVISIILEGVIFVSAGYAFILLILSSLSSHIFGSPSGWINSIESLLAILLLLVTPPLTWYLSFLAHKHWTLKKADMPPQKKRTFAICLTVLNLITWFFILHLIS